MPYGIPPISVGGNGPEFIMVSGMRTPCVTPAKNDPSAILSRFGSNVLCWLYIVPTVAVRHTRLSR
eukprot:3936105-Rhodomonas_salina.6